MRIRGGPAVDVEGHDLTRAALIAGIVFLLWRAARTIKELAWTAFGLGVAAYWTGWWPW